MRKHILVLCIFILSLWGAVTAQAKTAEYPYYIAVNLTQNMVTVYSKDANGAYTVPEKAFICSVGAGTPTGTFQTTDKYEWRPLFGNVYGQYATRITGHILFHSVPYFEKDKSTLEYLEYNKLGTEASMGCIRLTVEDVKWLYDYCPKGTTVRMYHSTEAEPLQPKTPQKIDIEDARRGWDPTDSDPNNPWKIGEIREMKLESGKARKIMSLRYQEGNYWVKAEDGKTIFGLMGIHLVLPKMGAESENESTAEVLFEKQSYTIGVVQQDGVAYFKVRDLADMTGSTVDWDAEDREITFAYEGQSGREGISLFRWLFSSANQVKTASLALQ